MSVAFGERKRSFGEQIVRSIPSTEKSTRIANSEQSNEPEEDLIEIKWTIAEAVSSKPKILSIPHLPISKLESDKTFAEVFSLAIAGWFDGSFSSKQGFMESMSRTFEFLIRSSPVLYATQRESLLSRRAHQRLVCRCVLSNSDNYNLATGGSISLVFLRIKKFLESFEGEHESLRPVWNVIHAIRRGRLSLQTAEKYLTNCFQSHRGCGLRNCECTCLACGALSGERDDIKLIGTLFHQGFGSIQDFDWAFSWYALASALNVPSAMNSLGFMFQEGHGIGEVSDFDNAIKWYLKAAHLGDRTAQYNCGCAYYNGLGIEQDHTKAFGWYLKAALAGDPDAQAAVGDQYLMGDGVEKNTEKALHWHLKAAYNGSISAASLVAHHFYFGWAVKRDASKAYEWHLEAARRGSLQSQHYVGHMHYSGDGCEMHLSKAFEWWISGARQGYVPAMKSLSIMYSDNEWEHYSLVVADYWAHQASIFENQQNPLTSHERSSRQLPYASGEDFREYIHKMRDERGISFVAGFDSCINPHSKLLHLSKCSLLFDLNLIREILSFTGDSQFPMNSH